MRFREPASRPQHALASPASLCAASLKCYECFLIVTALCGAVVPVITTYGEQLKITAKPRRATLPSVKAGLPGRLSPITIAAVDTFFREPRCPSGPWWAERTLLLRDLLGDPRLCQVERLGAPPEMTLSYHACTGFPFAVEARGTVWGWLFRFGDRF